MYIFKNILEVLTAHKWPSACMPLNVERARGPVSCSRPWGEDIGGGLSKGKLAGNETVSGLVSSVLLVTIKEGDRQTKVCQERRPLWLSSCPSGGTDCNSLDGGARVS